MPGASPGPRRPAAPDVSVVIPAFDSVEHVEAALVSVLTQDIGSAMLEIVLVDDGSTDGTGEAAQALGDERIRVVAQANQGIVAALNRGLDEARGTFLARLDADDLMGAGRLAAQLAAMDGDPSLAVCGTDYALFGPGAGRASGTVVRMPRGDRACRQRLLLAPCHPSSGVMIRADVLRRSGARFREEYRHAEDYRMWCELSEWGRLRNLPMLGLYYRLHDRQVSVTHSARQRELHLRIARTHAARSGRAPLDSRDMARLLFPEPAATHGLCAAARQGAAMAPSAARAITRYPGVETARFVGRKVLEAMARTRRAPE
jgi:glycosyltransferase involved in cell wall biosynthesis